LKNLINRIIFITLGVLYIQTPAWTQQDLHRTDAAQPILKVAMSDDSPMGVGRLLYYALQRSGYQMSINLAGMRTSIASVDYGEAAILPSQTDGFDIQFPNIMKVPFPVDYVEFTAFTRSNASYDISTWEDIAGLRFCYRWQNIFVANQAARTGASKFIVVNETQEIWDTLLNNEADVAVLPRVITFDYRIPPGIKKSNVIDRIPCYVYVNKDFAFLIPQLEEAFRALIGSGTPESIRDFRLSKRDSGGKQVLLHISSYDARVQREHSQIEVIRQALEAHSNVEYRNINLNSYEHRNDVGFNSYYSDMIRANYIAHDIDVVLASDNEAFKFVWIITTCSFPQNRWFFAESTILNLNRDLEPKVPILIRQHCTALKSLSQVFQEKFPLRKRQGKCCVYTPQRKGFLF